MRESPLILIWDGDKLVGLQIHSPTAASPQANKFELEVVRIFEENKRLRDCMTGCILLRTSDLLSIEEGRGMRPYKLVQNILRDIRKEVEQALKGE